MKKYNLKEFELSQSYLFYYDKLEKSNWFLEQILDTLDEPLDGRLIQTLLADPVGDGGQWDMVCWTLSGQDIFTHTLLGCKSCREVRHHSSATLPGHLECTKLQRHA